jgi:hypothetical protein
MNSKYSLFFYYQGDLRNFMIKKKQNKTRLYINDRNLFILVALISDKG